MKYAYKKMKENYEVIRKVCEKYRNEITAFAAAYGLEFGVFNECNDYISFMNELTFDEFVGNQMVGLSDEGVINTYKCMISGDLTFDTFVKNTFGEKIFNNYLELIS